MISISKIFLLSGIIFGDWAISLSFCKILLSGVSKHRFTCVEKRNWEKLDLTNCYSIIFGLWAEKNWTFSKTVKHDSQNSSLRVQRNNDRNFPGATIIVWNFSVFERKDRIFCEIFYSGLPKAHFTCSMQHFEEKMMKVDFISGGFFGTLCDFFTLKEELALGVKTTY